MVSAGQAGMRKLLEVWASTEEKVRLLAFYRQNPGVVETVAGLARRLAIPPTALAREIEDYVATGILRERPLRQSTVYVFDERRWKELEEMLREEVARAGDGGDRDG